jgi:hypothetical protein
MVVLNVLACWELRGIQQNLKEKKKRKEMNAKELRCLLVRECVEVLNIVA